MNAGRFNGHGFTLLELMVVIVLIGVLAAVILPEMRGTYEDALLRSAGRTLAGACQMASSRAVVANQIHQVRLDRSRGRYVIEARVPQADGTRFLAVRALPGGEGTWDTRIKVDIQNPADAAAPELDAAGPLPTENSSDLERSVDAIAFYPDGTADSRRILLRDRAGVQLALEINPVTARLKVVDLPGQANQ